MTRFEDCSAFRTCAEGRLFIAVVWHSAYSHRHVLHVQLQDVCLAVGLFVRIPVRGCLLGLRLVRWGSMSLHGLCGCMCHFRYSMGRSRCAPPQRLCIPGAKLFGEGGQLPYLHTAPPSIPRVMPPTRKSRNLGVGRAVFGVSDVDVPRGEEPALAGSPPDKRAV